MADQNKSTEPTKRPHEKDAVTDLPETQPSKRQTEEVKGGRAPLLDQRT